jgi:DnaJ-class molecular chaperone
MNKEEQKDETSKDPAIVGNTVLATVPYQCCPLCNGTGRTVADGFTSSVYQTCKVCNGARIIPMHIVDWRFKE